MPFKDERKFLHDLANPLSIAHGNLKIALRKMDGFKDSEPELQEVLERLNKAMEAFERMAKQFADRRQALLEKEQKPAAG